MATLKHVAVIDIGSNTVRLVIYQLTELYDFHELQNVKLPVRLYQYLDQDKNLAKKGIDKLVEVIRLFQKVMGHYQLDDVIATATAVIRQANNQEEVLASVAQETGLSLRLLSDEEEASYGQYAITRSTQFNEGYTVDMGGGSTEVTYFKNGVIKHYHSFPFGVVTLQELFYATADKKADEKAAAYIKEQISQFSWIKPRKLPIIAIGGSSRNIASVHQRMIDYPMSGIHEYEMSREDLQQTYELFDQLTVAQKQNLDGLSRDRADIITPANLLYLCLFDAVAAEKFVFCHRGLREGLLMERINQEAASAYTPNNVRKMTVRRLADLYLADAVGASQRLTIAKTLLAELEAAGLLYPTQKVMDYLEAGTYLYHLGAYVEEDDSSMHSFYLLANSNLSGFSHKSRLSLALVASYKNKSLFNQFLRQYKNWLNPEALQVIREVGSIIKFCDALAITRVNEIRKLKFRKKDKGTYTLKIIWKYDPLAEYYRATRQKKNLEYVLGKTIELDFQKEEGS